jgi:hypothetical protein
MKKILIAGDSYASDTLKSIKGEDRSNKWSWPFLLSTNYDITNIAYPGTSLFWTYKQLTSQNLKNYDKVIVIVTCHGRLTLSNPKNPKGIMSIPNYATLISRVDMLDSKNEKLKWAKYYYEHFYDEELELIAYKATIDKIIEMVPSDKLILLNGLVTDQISNQINFSCDLRIKDISLKEVSWVANGKNLFIDYYETDMHCNHMIIENKVTFSKLIVDLIENGNTDIGLNNFVSMKPEEFNLYFRKN